MAWTRFPPGGALVVANHSRWHVRRSSASTPDKFGYDDRSARSADMLVLGLTGDLFRRTGIRATRENAAKALWSGGSGGRFPGGDASAYRPTFANVIDFSSRKEYVSTAVEAGVRPSTCRRCPSAVARKVSSACPRHLARPAARAQATAPQRHPPISFISRSGFSAAIPPICRCPPRIVMQVLGPINLTKQFEREDPDVGAVDEHVRSVMRRRPRQRRFPILG